MLRIGLTGGIAAGKSLVAARLQERGAVLIDADRLAREVVAPGTDGLAAVVDAFGSGVLAGDGSLDRPALGAVVFGDDGARATLNGIIHPRVRAEAARRIAAAPHDAVVVQDIPLLVETGQAEAFMLVIVVQAPAEARVRRMIEQRGMSAEDARARMAAQASDAERAAVADVLLTNDGSVDALTDAVDRFWDERIGPFEAALLAGRPGERGNARARGADAGWSPDDGVLARAAARIRRSGGDAVGAVEVTAGDGVPDLVVSPGSTAGGAAGNDDDALTAEASTGDALAGAVTAAGYPPVPGSDGLHAAADPAQPVVVRIRRGDRTP
ncbi:dephospho-CoA kinase [Tersicoccus sp. Bi-70]|uniref:dephospho-CoA kinase n=1 Tax=Tersicoccus sp. Bi-70 TaxID=1897634 RepID=UPI0009760DBC|nr:dephospho-CoA kinase [Tersicoccus sp. Bi-70]OMH33096.1 dephospho-CoA kinase [Tersicoccus sp. Bi-70]